jgi:ubiquitin-conjugating enzyme E2 M
MATGKEVGAVSSSLRNGLRQGSNSFGHAATFDFDTVVPLGYPHEPPVIVLKTVPIYHPNINFEGKICLNVLRDGWQPVMTITHVIYGLLLLFEQPNPHDPLPNGIDGEWEAANLLRKDPRKFEEMVNSTLEGGFVRRLNKHFPSLKRSASSSGRPNNHHQ